MNWFENLDVVSKFAVVTVTCFSVLFCFGLLSGDETSPSRSRADGSTVDAQIKGIESALAKDDLETAQRQIDFLQKSEPSHPRIDSFREQVRQAREQDRTEQIHAIRAQIDELVATGLDDDVKLHNASDLCKKLQEFETAESAATANCEMIVDDWQQKQEAIEASERRLQVEHFVERANAVARDKALCDTPLEIKKVWSDLKTVTPDDEDFKMAKRAARRLERCRKKVEREFSKGIRDVMSDNRKRWADNYQMLLLRTGMDAHISVRGKYNRKVRFKYILLSRPLIVKLSDAGLLQELESMGFEEIVFTDGRKRWTQELSPQDESAGGNEALGVMGLDQPLKLEE